MRTGDIEQIKSDMKNGVYNFTDNGKCICCGNCCTNLLPMTKREIEQVHRYIEAHEIKEYKNNFPLSTVHIDMTCPFRDNKNKVCTIYQIRPLICKSFKCDTSCTRDPELYKEARIPINVREEFYGKNSVNAK